MDSVNLVSNQYPYLHSYEEDEKEHGYGNSNFCSVTDLYLHHLHPQHKGYAQRDSRVGESCFRDG